MALDPTYFVTSDLDTYFVDKDTGEPLANGILTFYRDSARTVLKDVFQLTGSPPNYGYTALPNPLTLSAVGTVQNAAGDNVVIYYHPFDVLGNLDLYYVTVTDSAGEEQLTREAWPNQQGTGSTPSNIILPTDNQIANPTFTNIFLNEGQTTTYTVGGSPLVFACAPDWDFVINGTGTVVVQRIPVAGTDAVPLSPPYVLDVNVSAGVTSCILRQRFNYNSGLWGSFGTTSVFLNGSIVAKNLNPSITNVEMVYAPSSGPTTSIMNVNVGFLYEFLSGTSAAPIPASTDPNLGVNGYVDIQVIFQESSHIRISCIDMFPSLQVQNISPNLDSSNRNEAYQGDYYIPRLNAKTQESFLVGWDFPMNPFQFGNSGNLNTTVAQYIADQTIAKAFASSIFSYSQNPSRGFLTFDTSTGNTVSYYIAQYLSANTVKDLINSRLSVNILGQTVANPGGNYNNIFRVYLFRAPSTASFPILPAELGTLNADGTFTLSAAGWTTVPRSGLDTAQATVNTTTGTNVFNPFEFGFSGWEITDRTQLINTDKFAIVVTVTSVFSVTVRFGSISLVSGDIPCRPAAKTYDQTLEECQFYYEKSYEPNTLPATNTDVNLLTRVQSVAPLDNAAGNIARFVYPSNFDLQFKTVKRVPPNVTFYSDISVNRVEARIQNANITNMEASALVSANWTATIGTKGAYYATNASTILVGLNSPDNGLFGSIKFHYVANAQLGIIP